MAGISLPGFGGGVDLSRVGANLFRNPVTALRNATQRYAAGRVGGEGIIDSLGRAAVPTTYQQSIGIDLNNPYQSFSPARLGSSASVAAPETGTGVDTPFLPPPVSGGGAGGAGGYAPEYVQGPDGRLYDINDPTQANEYYAMLQQNQESEQERAYREALTGINEDTRLLDEQAVQVGKSFEQQLKDLFEGKQTGDVRRQNYFAQLSPNAYQSSEGSGAQYANTLYDEGRGEINQAIDQTLGPGFLTTGQIGAGSQFGRQRQQLRQEGDTVTADYQQRIADIRNQVAGLKQAGLIGSGQVSPAQYNRQSYTPLQAQQVDTSRFEPFLTFQNQSTPDANLFRQFVRPNTTGAPVADYLGYKKPEEKKDSINSYLYR